MKKVLFMLAAWLIYLSANAQFKLTINGFVDENDIEKDYVVYNFEGETQESLYTKVLKFINTSYKSPKDVINEVKPEMITISGFQESCISIGKVKKVLGQSMSMTGQNWLNFLHTRERFTGVLQNEFGEIDLDTALIGDETCVEALNDGCICCSLADSLRPGILRLIQNTPADQLILETTGLANPDNVVHSLEELNDICKIGLVVSVADAPNLTEHPEYLNEKLRLAQLTRADVIVVSKADLVCDESIERLTQSLHDLNSKALIILSANGDANFAVLDHFFNHWIDKKYGMFTSRKHTPGADTMLLNNAGFSMRGNTSLFETCAVKFSEPLELERIEPIIRNSGKKVLRAKGIVDIVGKGCCEVQYTDGMLSISQARDDLQACDRWLTIIGKGLRPQTGSTTIRKSRCL